MSSDANPFTEQDLEFLQRPLYGFVSVAAGPVPPQSRPIWFEATAERTIQLFTGPDTAKARRLRRDPRAIGIAMTPGGPTTSAKSLLTNWFGLSSIRKR
jgi:hypothetical protein